MTLDGFEWFTQEEITTPRNGYEAVVNSWWSTDEQGRVAVFRRHHPQCNTNRLVADAILKRGVIPGAVSNTLIPLAFIPPAPHDA